MVQTVSPSGSMKKEELLALAAACETASTHPIGISILAAAETSPFRGNAQGPG